MRLPAAPHTSTAGSAERTASRTRRTGALTLAKQARKAPRAAAKAAAQKREIAARRQRRQLRIAVVLGILSLGTLITLLLMPSGDSTPVPAGTRTFSESDHDHVTGTVHYNRTPPAGGAHSSVWLNCGVYSQPVRSENAVHSLEHGTVWITYQPALLPAEIAALQHLVKSNYVAGERYLILSPYVGMASPIEASAWGAQLGLASAEDPRLASFIHHFAGGGQGGEPGGPCTGGTGRPAG
jgi:hypothetical protein